MPGMSRPHLAQVPTLTEVIDVPQAAAQAQPTRPMNREPAVMAAAPVMRPPVPLDDLPVLGEVVAPPAEQQATENVQQLMLLLMHWIQRLQMLNLLMFKRLY